MLEIAAILKSASSISPVTIDEWGRRAGTADIYGLADAIRKHMETNSKCPCLFATHAYDLTAPKNDVLFIFRVNLPRS